MRIIGSVYHKYFQKSRAFVYPLLGISRFTAFQPGQVYLLWPAMRYGLDSGKIIAVFAYEDREPGWRQYLDVILLKNKYFEDLYPLSNNQWAFIFDLSSHQEDITKVLTGKYSQLSEHTKTCIREFFGIGTPEWVYMESYMTPESHFATYAKLLEVDEKELRALGELCDKPNLPKETLLEAPKNLSLPSKHT